MQALFSRLVSRIWVDRIRGDNAPVPRLAQTSDGAENEDPSYSMQGGFIGFRLLLAGAGDPFLGIWLQHSVFSPLYLALLSGTDAGVGTYRYRFQYAFSRRMAHHTRSHRYLRDWNVLDRLLVFIRLVTAMTAW